MNLNWRVLIQTTELISFSFLFSTVVSGSIDEELSSEQLDVLQMELEDILSSVSKRIVMLDTETHALTDWADKKEKKTPGKQVKLLVILTSN